MNNTKPLLALLTLSLMPAFGAAMDLSIAAEIRLGKVAPPPPPAVVVVEEPVRKGPPPWAPAHGFRRNRAYYYYPGTHVYYRPADRMWIYLDGRDWRVGVSLPTTIRVDFERGVSLTMETDKPYEFHESIRTHYPSDYFETKVRLKEPKGNSGQNHPERHGAQERGKGKGKGKGKDQ